MDKYQQLIVLLEKELRIKEEQYDELTLLEAELKNKKVALHPELEKIRDDLLTIEEWKKTLKNQRKIKKDALLVSLWVFIFFFVPIMGLSLAGGVLFGFFGQNFLNTLVAFIKVGGFFSGLIGIMMSFFCYLSQIDTLRTIKKNYTIESLEELREAKEKELAKLKSKKKQYNQELMSLSPTIKQLKREIKRLEVRKKLINDRRNSSLAKLRKELKLQREAFMDEQFASDNSMALRLIRRID